MKVKVCGMREPDNITALLELPVDMLGFIFHPASPRFVGERDDLPAWIAQHEDLFGHVRRVGVFVNAEIDDILNATHDYALHYVQLHGAEPPEYLAELQRFWNMSSFRKAGLIKAFGVDAQFDAGLTQAYEPYCAYFLFDTKTPKHGGSGKSFEWRLLESYTGSIPFLLSGGIEEESLPALRAWSHPRWVGVDINSRFETSPGQKDPVRIERFIREFVPEKFSA